MTLLLFVLVILLLILLCSSQENRLADRAGMIETLTKENKSLMSLLARECGVEFEADDPDLVGMVKDLEQRYRVRN